jgi:hypothetical protein
MSAYMVIAPILSGFLYEIHHSGPYILSAVLLMLGVYFALMFKQRREVERVRVDDEIYENKVEMPVKR